jgi:hypothetical protein
LLSWMLFPTRCYVRRSKPLFTLMTRLSEMASRRRGWFLPKNPSNYEAFSPEEVGLQRQIIIGKHSGSKALIHKFNAEFGIELDADMANRLLERVRATAVELKRPLFDKELMLLYKELNNGVGQWDILW